MMQKTQLIGRLGGDAVVNNVNGRNVINFTVAVSRSYKDAQGVKKEFTDWFSCSWWSDKSGIVPYLKSGTQVYVEGEVGAKTYTNKEGKTAVSLTLNVKMIQLLGSNKNENNSQVQEVVQPTETIDDLLF